MFDAFISYSRNDLWIMRAIRAELTASGFVIWADENLSTGDPSWQNTIQAAIDNTACIVAILTESAKESPWIGRELEYARVQEKTVIPVLATGDERTSIPIQLINAQRLDIRSNYEMATDHIVYAIKQCIGAQQNLQQSQKAGLSHVIRWDRTGSLFWLVNDMNAVMDATRDGTPERIRWALRQSHHHAQRLHLGDSIESKLLRLKEAAEYYTDDEWTTDRRRTFHDEILEIRGLARNLAVGNDPDWEPFAVENREESG